MEASPKTTDAALSASAKPASERKEEQRMSQEPKYHFHIAIPLRLIGPLTELLAQDGLLIDMRHEAEAQPPNGPAKNRAVSSPPRRRYPRISKETGMQLILRILLESGNKAQDDLATVFSDAGRAPHSASSAASSLAKLGLISREVRGNQNWLSLTEKGKARAEKEKARANK